MEESFSILEATKLTLAKLIVLCLVLSLQLNNPPQNMPGCLCHCQLMIIFVPLPFSLPLPGNVRWCLFTCPCRCPIVNKGLMASTLSRSEHKLWPCLGRWQALLRENKQGKPGKLQATKTNHEQYHHILLHLNIVRILKIFNVFFSATISWPCWTSSLSNCYFLVV